MDNPRSGSVHSEGRMSPPRPINEPVLDYASGSTEREELEEALSIMSSRQIEIPLIIGGEEVHTDDVKDVVMPHDHQHVLARFHRAGREEALAAIEAAREAWQEWANWPWQDRVAVLLRAAELLAGPWRARMNAATMLGQSKTIHQAEIDAACEIVDFWRFNSHNAAILYEEQPDSSPGVWNRMDHRPLEGFVLAITPFNFTSIGANLPTAPAVMGCTTIWKPATTGVFGAYYTYRLLEAAGLPPGVISFLPGRSAEISETLIGSPELAGIHFTGSTGVFQQLWKQVADNLENYRTYPRIVGETGGKDFIVAHASADMDALATGIIRGAFEYQGQKCSAASRVYIPDTMWAKMKDRLLSEVESIQMGDVTNFRNFMGAVIDEKAFKKITSYIEDARSSSDAEVLVGGESDGSEGYFIRPTILQAKRPDYVTMCEEIFGPVVTIYVYPENQWAETLELVDNTSPYALTGAVFATDRKAITEAHAALRHAAGNFYVNDKPTGAVVGQQPFGGSRASGTNDKAGSGLNLVRWVSARTVKELFVPPTDYRHPYMGAE